MPDSSGQRQRPRPGLVHEDPPELCGSCDWGGCDDDGAGWAWTVEHGWLAVCEKHRQEATDQGHGTLPLDWATQPDPPPPGAETPAERGAAKGLPSADDVRGILAPGAAQEESE